MTDTQTHVTRTCSGSELSRRVDGFDRDDDGNPVKSSPTQMNLMVPLKKACDPHDDTDDLIHLACSGDCLYKPVLPTRSGAALPGTKLWFHRVTHYRCLHCTFGYDPVFQSPNTRYIHLNKYISTKII